MSILHYTHLCAILLGNKEKIMSMSKSAGNSEKKRSPMSMAILFVAINCIIVSVLTLALSAMAVLTNNYDKWFPVALCLSVVLFYIGRKLLSKKLRYRLF